jgi:hypothetical protein
MNIINYSEVFQGSALAKHHVLACKTNSSGHITEPLQVVRWECSLSDSPKVELKLLNIIQSATNLPSAVRKSIAA